MFCPTFSQEWEQYVPGFAQGMARKSRESRTDLGFPGPVIAAIAVLNFQWVSGSVEQVQYTNEMSLSIQNNKNIHADVSMSHYR